MRSDGSVYRIKSNAIQSLAVQPTGDNGTATFFAKANVLDVTDPDNTITMEGNGILTITMTDLGEPGDMDSIAIALWRRSGELLFSNNWSGAETLGQILDGGNIAIHAGGGKNEPQSFSTEDSSTESERGPEPVNDSDDADAGARVAADLSIATRMSNSAPTEGEAVGYTIKVTNNSTSTDATGVVVSVPLPSGVTYVQDNEGAGYDPITGLWDVGNIAVGGNATLSIRISVDAGMAGFTIITSAEITAADQTDPELGNNSNSADITVVLSDG